jgi:glutaminase
MSNIHRAACRSPILGHIEELHREFAKVTDGAVATYIPELAKADPNWFGICVVTVNSGVYEAGDSRQQFTIQSISKPFVYGLALEDRGRAEVLAKIGVEPTGDAFNAVSLDPATGRPRNPMINAGAIAATGLIEGKSPGVRLRRIMAMLELYAGHELTIDDAVYHSESQTGHRNRAIGHMLRNFDVLTEDPTPVVDVYFHQCSALVDCRDLAVMAATLANRGVNPITGRQAIRGEYVESVLSVMGTCGMYDYAGEWLYDVGIPAKSGVAGGVIAVLPGQLGIGVYSPLLDPQGNSVRGIRVCEALSRHWDLHLFNRPGIGRSAIRLRSTAADYSSSRIRTAAESEALRDAGSRIQLFQLQGNLPFGATEAVVRELIEATAAAENIILDFKRVLTVSESACRLFAELLCQVAGVGGHIVFTHIQTLPDLRRYMKARLAGGYDELFHVFEDNDSALEWCENRLLAGMFKSGSAPGGVTASDNELLSGLAAADVGIVEKMLQRRVYQPGEVIINAGDKADELFLLAGGHVSVFVPLASGRRRRLATFSPGMAFGEMAIIDRAPRSAMIVADSEVTCDALALHDFEALGATHPHIRIRMLENLARGLSRKLRKANREIAVLE